MPVASSAASLLTLVLVFFMFPIFWILLMSFQTNEHILRIPPQHLLRADARQLHGADLGPAEDGGRQRSTSPSCAISGTAFVLSSASVLLALLLGVPAAYAFARFKFRLGENIAFTLLSFRFAPPLLVLLPLIALFSGSSASPTPISASSGSIS